MFHVAMSANRCAKIHLHEAPLSVGALKGFLKHGQAEMNSTEKVRTREFEPLESVVTKTSNMYLMLQIPVERRTPL